jgi:plasmid replication protein
MEEQNGKKRRGRPKKKEKSEEIGKEKKKRGRPKKEEDKGKKFSELTSEEVEKIREKYNKMRRRVFNIMQYVEHPISKKPLLNENQIIRGIESLGKCEYAYILHDKDKDEKGILKKPHFHIVINMENATSVFTIAKKFDILPNFINLPKGKSSFGDCIEYLTHQSEEEQRKGKFLYSDDEVKSNFDFKKLIEETVAIRARKILREGTETKQTYFFKSVRNGDLTLKEVEEEDEDFYFDNEKELKYFRKVYLQERAPMPRLRLCFYIYGEGGVGKDVMSKALARALVDRNNVLNLEDEEIFFEVGTKKVLFDGYDGQDVVIWSDFRAEELLKCFDNDRGSIFKIFDPFPRKVNQNVKYGKVNLINTYNIVNSVESFEEFANFLVGNVKHKGRFVKTKESEDIKQVLRRFPFIIPIRASEFDIMMNSGFLGLGSYDNYIGIGGIVANIREVAEIKDEKLKKKIERKVTKKVINKVSEVENKFYKEEETEEEKFANFGKTKEEIEVETEVLSNDEFPDLPVVTEEKEGEEGGEE